MKTGMILLLIGFGFAIGRMSFHVSVYYEYEAKIGCYWDLADKASTLSQKSKYIDSFVNALDSSNLFGINDALFFPTPSNSFDSNFEALKSLQKRLHDIDGIDENSFAYQAAIQQITSQEQGEALNMLEVIRSCWVKKNYYTSWNFIYVIIFTIIQGTLIIIGFALLDDY